MKEIVVAIDFSRGSIHALRFAINIANQLESNILMVHVYKHGSVESIYKNAEKDELKEINLRLNKLVEKHQKLLKKGTITFKVRTGKVYKEVVNQAKYSDAYMIVAGTHGVSGFEEFWIGSNAYRIVSSAFCPVITIRNGFCGTDKITKIVMPIDDTRDTRQKVPFVESLAKTLNAEVYILALTTTKIKEVHKEVDRYAEQAAAFLEKSGIKYNIVKQTVDNVAEGIIEYATEINAQLIASMTDQGLSSSKIWLGPYAQQLVNHSGVPILSIHPKEIYGINAGL